MSVYRVIDKLESLVGEGTWLPFGYRIVSYERLLDLVEKLRSTLPDEVGRAKVISTNKDRVIREAQEKAQQIVSEATTAHAALVDQSDVVRQARAIAEKTIRDAEEAAARIRAGADGYAAQVLTDLEGRRGTALRSVRAGREALTSASDASAATTNGAYDGEVARESGRRRAAYDGEDEPAGRGREVAVPRLGKRSRESARG